MEGRLPCVGITTQQGHKQEEDRFKRAKAPDEGPPSDSHGGFLYNETHTLPCLHRTPFPPAAGTPETRAESKKVNVNQQCLPPP